MNVVSPENVCTCKDCNHDYARNCDSCICCTLDSHSMLLDGIEGFGPKHKEEPVHVPVGPVELSGDLSRPSGDKQGMVVFAHGSGSSRHSPRNRLVAGVLQKAGFGTLLFDLLTEEEEKIDELTGHLRFDILLLADRLIGVTDWLLKSGDISKGNDNFSIGYFGASTGAAAAIVAAARKGNIVKAIVSRGGRPDLAGSYLEQVTAPTLLIVGGYDEAVIIFNKEAFDRLNLIKDDDKKKLVIIPDASHLFEEPGKLEEVAQLALEWFERFLDHRIEQLGKGQTPNAGEHN
jgi:putative phosphoribosyl transferase